jgi:outer membrane receptor protein involved in Fe transport
MTLAIGSRLPAAQANPADPLTASNDQNPASSAPLTVERASESDSALPIIVTGSRIPRTGLTAVSPVTIINSDEIKLQGATNIEEVLNQLPQVNPSEGEFVSAGATGTATVDLRGLGAVRTLVLVNGHRVMPGDPRFSVADINSIPTSIIQHVEVLTGGAAAVYGSDAVAGVVNFILDNRLDGVKVDGLLSGYQHDNRNEFMQGLLGQRQIRYPKGSVFDGRRDNVSLAFGHSFFNDRAHVTVYGAYRNIGALSEDRRDYSSCALTAQTFQGSPTSVLECGGAFLAYPGNFTDKSDNTYQVTAERTFVPGVSRFNYAPYNFYQRPDKHYTAGGFANLDLSTAIQPFAEIMYMHDRSLAQTSPSGDANTQTINCDNPLLSAQQRSLICRPGNFVGEENGGPPMQFVDPVSGATYNRGWLFIARRSVESGPTQDDLTHKSIRLLAGSRGELGRGVSYDSSYSFGRVDLDWQSRNNLSISRLDKALDVVADPSTGEPICRSALIARELGPAAPGADSDCVPWDVFAPGQVTPQSVAYLSLSPFMRGSFKQQVANANATVQLDRWGLGSPWSEESPAINIGSEYRKDSVDFEPDESVRNGDVAGFAPQVVPIRGSIDTKEIFAEARIPLITEKLVRRLAFEGGFRKSWYENAKRTFSIDAYKLALDLTAVTGLRLRASQQRAIRAPNVQELFTPVRPDSFDLDPCAGSSPAASEAQCALTGVTPAQYGHVVSSGSLLAYNSIIGGNEDLQPETATTRSIGIVVEPRLLRGFNATVDWWDIRLEDAIARIGAQTIIDTCIASGDPAFCSRIHRDPNGSLWLGGGHVDDRQANIGGLRVRGIDLAANALAPLGRMGSAKFEFRGSYVIKWIVDNGGLSAPYDCAGLFGDPCDIRPRWKHSLRTTWNRSPAFSLSVQWRHIGGVKLAALDPKFGLTDSISPANTKLRSENYFDVATLFRIRDRFDLQLGANNILDRQPPLIVRNTAAAVGLVNGNTYPELYDALGRYVFASVSMNFKP